MTEYIVEYRLLDDPHWYQVYIGYSEDLARCSAEYARRNPCIISVNITAVTDGQPKVIYHWGKEEKLAD